MIYYDIAIVGAGPGGYTAAIQAANSGFSVVVIEGGDIGGTCLNKGCIPSKTFLKYVKGLDQSNTNKFNAKNSTHNHSLDQILVRKNKLISSLRNGIKTLLSENKVNLMCGTANVQTNNRIEVELDGTYQEIKADYIILANGSRPNIPDIPGLDRFNYYTSDTIFEMKEMPSSIAIFGGGVIGLEIATTFHNIGLDVYIVEVGDRILPTEDKAASEYLYESMIEQGIHVYTSTEVMVCSIDGTLSIKFDGQVISIHAEVIMVATGRTPNTTGIECLPIQYEDGFVSVSEFMETSLPSYYAIGDLIGGYQLSHAAMIEAIIAIQHIAGKEVEKKPLIPRCIFTSPEVASIGKTEEQAIHSGYDVITTKVDLGSQGNKGFMKTIANKKDGKVLGVVMVGPHVTEMISQPASLLELEGSVEELGCTVFPKPAISKLIREGNQVYQERIIF